tara:strand:+ start:548 stop:694 length:147 start_codon:yes stop_codon:yes gene_type:complete
MLDQVRYDDSFGHFWISVMLNLIQHPERQTTAVIECRSGYRIKSGMTF